MPRSEPQAHDVLMDFVVTELGIDAVVDGGLVRIAAEECQQRLARLALGRRLPRAGKRAPEI